MKHLHFVQSLEPLQGGGLGRAACDLHQTFLQLGVASRLVATTARGNEHTEIPGVRLLPRVGPTRAFFSADLYPLAKRWVRDSDVVHGHGFYVGTNWAFGRTARRYHRALVLHPHGMFEPWILRRSPIKKNIVHLLFESANFRAARLWRALTDKEADQIRGLRIEAPIVVAPNGVDPEPFDRQRTEGMSRDGESKTLLFLGRLHPKKGIDLLIEAWAGLGKRERKDWTLVIAGPDEGGHRAELEALAGRHELQESIRFPGLVTGDDKTRLLLDADLFVLSSHSEGFPVAILEAMAARVPVVATGACNMPDLFTEGGGWECEPDVTSVRDALRHALTTSDAERRQRGETGRKLLDRKYTWQSCAKTLLEACEHHCG